MKNYIAFDADGVLLDSEALAWKAANTILRPFNQSVQIDSSRTYRDYFGKAAQEALVGEPYAATLRAMHRLLMRFWSNDCSLFDDVLQMVVQLPSPKAIVTSALADGVVEALGPYASNFEPIIGYETGRKGQLLKQLLETNHISLYVTDTARDIKICRTLGIPVVAVTWGYESRHEVASAKPDFIVENTEQLKTIFSTIGGHNDVINENN